MTNQQDQSRQDRQSGLTTALRQAVRRETAPPYLEARIRQGLREDKSKFRWNGRLRMLPAPWLAACAVLLLAAIALPLLIRSSGPGLDTPAAQAAFIDRISTGLAPFLRVGLADHVHCAVLRSYPFPLPSPAEAVRELGSGYRGLYASIDRLVPAQYSLAVAHHCTYRDRGYIHLIFRAHDASLLSLVLTKRAGENPAAEGLIPMIERSGLSVYGARARDFEVAGFEAEGFLVYVVSELPASRNLQLALSVAPVLRDFLKTL